MIKQLFIDIRDKVLAIQDNNIPIIKYFDLWNRQLEFLSSL